MRVACWISKATNTHSDYVILNVFPLQQWLHERASLLRYTYIACLVSTKLFAYKALVNSVGQIQSLSLPRGKHILTPGHSTGYMGRYRNGF